MLPGLLLVGLYLVYVLGVSRARPDSCPPIGPRDIEGAGEQLSPGRVWHVLIVPLLLIALVLGSILAGIATPTESAALGATGTLLLVAAGKADDRSPLRKLYRLCPVPGCDVRL